MRTCTSLPRVPRAESPPRPLRRRAALLSSGPRSSSGRGTPRRGAGCSEQRLSEAATRSGGRATAPGGPGAGAHPSPSPSMAGGSGDDRPREGRRPKAHLSKSLRPPPGGTEPAWRPPQGAQNLRGAPEQRRAAVRLRAARALGAPVWRATGEPLARGRGRPRAAPPPPAGARAAPGLRRQPGWRSPAPVALTAPNPPAPPTLTLPNEHGTNCEIRKGIREGNPPFEGGFSRSGFKLAHLRAGGHLRAPRRRRGGEGESPG